MDYKIKTKFKNKIKDKNQILADLHRGTGTINRTANPRTTADFKNFLKSNIKIQKSKKEIKLSNIKVFQRWLRSGRQTE